jgi:hypothetical protein
MGESVNTNQTIIRVLSISLTLGLGLCATGRAQEMATPADVHPSLNAATSAPSLFDLSAATSQTVTQTTVSATTPPKPTLSDDIADGKWHFSNTGYTWLPSVHGTSGIGGYNAGLNITAWDLVKNTTFSIQDLFEPQYKRISFPIDFIWLRLNASKAVPFDPNYTFNVKATQSILTPKVAFLLVNQPTLKIYGTAGLHYWHLGLTETLTPPLSTGAGLYQSANWADFALGARGNLALSRRLSFTVAGDAGKGGANVDYQVAGLLGYQINKIFKWEVKKRMVAEAGWRYMNVQYNAGAHQVIFYPQMSGFIIGITTRYK